MQTNEYRHLSANEQTVLKRHPDRAALKRILAPLTEAVARTKPGSNERASLLAERSEINKSLSRKRHAE